MMPTSGEALNEQLDVLRQMSYSELAKRSRYAEQDRDCSDGRHKLAIWTDIVDNSEVRVVVQAYRHVLMGVGVMQADGFRIAPNGESRKLDPSELTEFT